METTRQRVAGGPNHVEIPERVAVTTIRGHAVIDDGKSRGRSRVDRITLQPRARSSGPARRQRTRIDVYAVVAKERGNVATTLSVARRCVAVRSAAKRDSSAATSAVAV
jgi:hypothetical protein